MKKDKLLLNSTFFIIVIVLIIVILINKTPSNFTEDSSDTNKTSVLQTEETASSTDIEKDETDFVNVASDITSAASTVFVYDISNDKYIFQKNTDQKIIPASITKILTILYALEVMPADEIISPGDELLLINKYSSIAYIKSSHKLTLEMLIEGMLLPSGNDAAYAVAAGTARYMTNNPHMPGQEAVDYFMTQLNLYAASIGCKNTNYTVPDGLAYENHYTTSDDLITIAKKALQNDIIMKYSKISTDKVFYASGETMTWKNTNELINPESEFYRSCVTGLKTGSLDNAYSLLVSADINGKSFIIGIFDATTYQGRFEIASEIIDILSFA